jgi:hypothetical protein
MLVDQKPAQEGRFGKHFMQSMQRTPRNNGSSRQQPKVKFCVHKFIDMDDVGSKSP